MGTFGKFRVDKNVTAPRSDLYVQSSRDNPSGAATSQRDEISESLSNNPTCDHPRRSNKRKRATLEAEIEAKRLRQEFDEHDEYDLDKMDRPWQIQLRKELQAAPDDRTIHWVYGPEGNEGKSTFVKCLVKKDWVVINAGGAAADMKYRYVKQGMTKNMVVDIPRYVQGVEYSGIYSLVEEVKNRLIVSTKYRPEQVVDVNRVHVVVMSNKKPNMGMLGKDRICLHDLSPRSVEVGCGNRPHSC